MNLKRFLFFFLLTLFQFAVHGQNISIKVEDQPLNEVLEQISKEYDLKLSFNADLLANQRVSIEATNEAVEDFLERLLSPFQLVAVRSKKNFFYIKSTQRKLIFVLSDAQKQTGIPFATVNVKNSFKGNRGNDNGVLEFTFNEKDTALMVAAFGYKTMEINPREVKGDTLRLNLQIASIDLEAVTILEYINRGIRLIGDISSPSIILSEMEVLPGLPEPDVLLSAQMLPGFESNDETAAGINVRGSEQSQTLLYWDRIPVYQPAHYFGQITSIIPSMTERIDAYKNYIPASFSGATSGLLNMRAEDSLLKETSFVSNTNFTHTDFTMKSPIGKSLSVLLGGRFSYNHWTNTPLFEAYSDKLFDGIRELDEDDDEDREGGIDINSTLQFRDVNAKVIFEPDRKNYFSLSTLINDDDLDFSAIEEQDTTQTLQNHEESFKGINAFYEHRFNNSWSSSLSLSFTDYGALDQSSAFFDEGDIVEYDSTFILNELKTMEAKTAITYRGWKNNILQFGYQLHRYNNLLEYRESSTYEAAITENRSTIERANGVYFLAELKPSEKLLIRPQIRADYFSNEEEFFINPIVNAQYELGKGFWLKSSFGYYTQALNSINDPTLTASNVNSAIWVLSGEEDTEVMRSRNGSFGLLYQQKGWIIDLDFYQKTVEGVSAINLFEESVSNELEFELGNTETSGMDLMIKKNFGKYHSWLCYTYSETRNTFEDFGSSFSSSIDRPHQLRWVHTYIINQFEISAGWSYKSGAPYTLGSRVDYDVDEDEYKIVFEEINNRRLPVYHRLDFSFWYRFAAKEKKFNGVVGLSFMNVYNRENIWKRFYLLEDLDDDDVPEIAEEERYFLEFTPNLTLKLNF